ncbi:hypothetical protein HUN08_14965 [Gordonia sp. X0973]|uniref:hypothetical protein n=1 Tax=Gordonia sp. X0973 TaxID=2742602 RepID=UPI000F53D801|nr:hypothetical protein [Gordonia sp. X0973]QKT08353.1 hypothetical protein HUN08_14965 [Gordonia sp. X0973]
MPTTSPNSDGSDPEETAVDDAKVEVQKRKRPPVEKLAKSDEPAAEPVAETGGSSPRQITLSVRTLVYSLVGALVLAGLLFGVVDNLRVRHKLNTLQTQQANNATAERIAGEYAVRAATLDYKDLTPWAANLKKGVSPQLSKQFDVAVSAMQQIFTPLRLTMKATNITSQTTKSSGDLYNVVAVVQIDTTSVQAPNGATTLAAYTVTMNKAENWMITAVGDPSGSGLPGMPKQQQNPQAPQQAPPTTTAPAPAPAPGG